MTRRKTLWESGFLATFRLMLHIKNRSQPILAARLSREAALSPRQWNAMFNEAGKCAVKSRHAQCRKTAICRIAPKKPKTNVVPLGFPAFASRARRALRMQTGQRASGGMGR